MKKRDLVRYLGDLGWREPAASLISAQAADGDESLNERGGGLAALAKSVEGCTRCALAEKRNTVVFGEGADDPELMFIGEAPGSEEDRTGRPFVGQAGKLLDGMIAALGLARTDVYIANVVKCRPPGNRNPAEPEMAACAAFLDRQIELLRPRVIVALGLVAARRLTGTAKPMKALRRNWAAYRGVPVLATYHPAYLLRNPRDKRAVWDDLKLVGSKLKALAGTTPQG
ncbi:MAG: uracil-DNA glycosylase [Acidobacteria bacterium]|jgi:uracil-DNA glycosylase|nr:uracil-DNA glycosylase [Acidobacteriota bacterium]